MAGGRLAFAQRVEAASSHRTSGNASKVDGRQRKSFGSFVGVVSKP
jgi:hypothetical protein